MAKVAETPTEPITVDTTVHVTFDGNKFYWRTRNTVDVIITEHKYCNAFEVVVYEPTLDKEAPRIYLDAALLLTKVHECDIDAKISFANRNHVSITEGMVHSIMNKAISDYILNRLIIKEFSVEDSVVIAEFQYLPSDTDLGDITKLIRSKPAVLVPYVTRHYKHLMEGAVEKVLEALEEDKAMLHESCEVAAEVTAEIIITEEVQERWRMPIVMNKVSRGQRLNSRDAKIFQKVQANMKTEDDVARMKKALNLENLKVVLPAKVVAAAPLTPTTHTPVAHPVKPRAAFNAKRFETVSSQSKVKAVAEEINKTPHARTPVGKGGKKKGGKKKGGKKGRKSTATGALSPTADNSADDPAENSDEEEEITEDSNLTKLLAGLASIGTTLRASISYGGGGGGSGTEGSTPTARGYEQQGESIPASSSSSGSAAVSGPGSTLTSAAPSSSSMVSTAASSSSASTTAAKKPGTDAPAVNPMDAPVVSAVRDKPFPKKRNAFGSFMLAFTSGGNAGGLMSWAFENKVKPAS